MAIDAASTQFSVDPRGLDGLRREARVDQRSPETLRSVAQQFESLFAQMLLKSMRAASFGDDLMGSEQGEFYRDMFDQQMSVELSQGRGLGLADMLVRQLSGVQGAPTRPAATAEPATASATYPATAPAATATGATAGAESAAVTGFRPGSREDFVRQLWPHAEAAGRSLGVDPATIVSHAALETGWGKSLPRQADGQTSFNLFGIKAGRGWGGASTQSGTLEYAAGVARRVVEPFRAYGSLGAAVTDYARLLSGNARYAAALNTGADVGAFAQALQRAGYATDPGYAGKLASVAAQVHRLLGRDDGLKLAAAGPLTSATRGAT